MSFSIKAKEKLWNLFTNIEFFWELCHILVERSVKLMDAVTEPLEMSSVIQPMCAFFIKWYAAHSVLPWEFNVFRVIDTTLIQYCLLLNFVKSTFQIEVVIFLQSLLNYDCCYFVVYIALHSKYDQSTYLT